MNGNEEKLLFVALLVLLLAVLALGGTGAYVLAQQPNSAKDVTPLVYQVPNPYKVYPVEHAGYVELMVYVPFETTEDQDWAVLEALVLGLKDKNRDVLIRKCTENPENFEHAAGCESFLFGW